MNVAVVILAGGEGSRIGGGKPLRLLGGRPLIDRAVSLAEQWSAVVAVAVRDSKQVGSSDARRIFDAEGIQGPLAGLAAALRFADKAGCDALLTIPADMPFLPSDLRERLVAAIADGTGAAIARSGGRLHPVCGLWRPSALIALPNYLAAGGRSLKGFAAAVGFTAAEWLDEPIDPFFNINSAENLAAAERMLGA